MEQAVAVAGAGAGGVAGGYPPDDEDVEESGAPGGAPREFRERRELRSGRRSSRYVENRADEISAGSALPKFLN